MVNDGPMAIKNENFVGCEGLAPAIKEILESEPSSSTQTSKQRNNKRRNRRLKLSANEDSKIPKSSVQDRRKSTDICRTKPNVTIDREFERNLARIATKGVVQLFNVVKEHQGKIDSVESKEKSEFRKEKILRSLSKEDFLDVLQGQNKKSRQESTRGSTTNNASAKWKVLRDDFLTEDKKPLT